MAQSFIFNETIRVVKLLNRNCERVRYKKDDLFGDLLLLKILGIKC